jgi:hypothetical protein
MKNILGGLAAAMLLIWGCASAPLYCRGFGEIDRNADGIVEWPEFKAAFPDADARAFLAADANKNGDVTPVEWQRFTAECPR